MNHQEFEFLEHSFRPALDSGLSVGDQLLQVDGQSLISVTHFNAIRFLKGIPFTQKTINFKLKFSKNFKLFALKPYP